LPFEIYHIQYLYFSFFCSNVKYSYDDKNLVGIVAKNGENNVILNHSYDRRNRLTEKIEGGIQTSYKYDPQGNLIAESGKHGTKNTHSIASTALQVYITQTEVL